MSRIQQPAAFAVGLSMISAASAQTDPGVRAGAVNGQAAATPTSPLPLPSVTANTPRGVLEFFDDGLDRFQEIDNVSGGTAGTGLGPRFNFDQCAACHSQPTFGGSSPANNPEASVINTGIVNGSTNSIPSFITATGPTRLLAPASARPETIYSGKHRRLYAVGQPVRADGQWPGDQRRLQSQRQ